MPFCHDSALAQILEFHSQSKIKKGLAEALSSENKTVENWLLYYLYPQEDKNNILSSLKGDEKLKSAMEKTLFYPKIGWIEGLLSKMWSYNEYDGRLRDCNIFILLGIALLSTIVPVLVILLCSFISSPILFFPIAIIVSLIAMFVVMGFVSLIAKQVADTYKEINDKSIKYSQTSDDVQKNVLSDLLINDNLICCLETERRTRVNIRSNSTEGVSF